MKNMRVELEHAVWEALEPFTEKAIRLDLNNPAQSVAFGAIVGAVVNAVEAVINKNFAELRFEPREGYEQDLAKYPNDGEES